MRSPAVSEFRSLEQFEFHHIIEQTPGVALVMFETAACGACKRFRQLLCDHAVRDHRVTVFTVDAGRDQALTREFEVFHLPAMFVYVDGAYQGQLQCRAEPGDFARALAELLERPAQEAP